MNFDDFEKIRRDLGGHLRDLEETLRDGVRSLESEWRHLSTLVGERGASAGVRTTPTDDSWTQKEFNRRICLLARLGMRGFPSLPREIHLSEMSPIFDKLLSATNQDGRERGRVVFTHLVKGNLVVGDTAVGTEQSVTNSTRPPRNYEGQPIYPVMDMHTHPRGPFEPAHFVEHFSETDLQGIVCSGAVLVTLMISRGVSLMAIRSLTTPRSVSNEEFNATARELRQYSERDSRYHGDLPRIQTKRLCRDYDLYLYQSKPESRGLFRRVEIPRKG